MTDSRLFPGIPRSYAALADRGPACEAVEMTLTRCLRLAQHRKDYGFTFPTVWRGVLLEMLRKAGAEPAQED